MIKISAEHVAIESLPRQFSERILHEKIRYSLRVSILSTVLSDRASDTPNFFVWENEKRAFKMTCN